MHSSNLRLLPVNLRNALTGALQPREQLRWVDRPEEQRSATAVLPALLIGLPFLGGGLLIIGSAMINPHQFLPALPDLQPVGVRRYTVMIPMGLVLVAVGFAALRSPWRAGRRMRQTVYAVTDRRALMVRRKDDGVVVVDSFLPEQLSQLRRIDRGNQVGDLVFAEREMPTMHEGPPTIHHVGFSRVRNAEAVEQLLRELASGARSTPR